MPPRRANEFDIGGTRLNWKFVAITVVIALGAIAVGTLLYVVLAAPTPA